MGTKDKQPSLIDLRLQKYSPAGYLSCALARTFGENFQRLQDRSGLSGRAIVQALKKKDPAFVSDLRKNKSGIPKGATLIKLATVLGCTVEELLEGIDDTYEAAKAKFIAAKAVDGGPSNEPDHRRLEREKQIAEEAKAIASRLFKFAGELEHRSEDPTAQETEASVRDGSRKAG